ncbi:hypothetical protein Tdes44962_MAKER02990 [Teratosphaeria destructans]|uniref:Uncharacterized protein n=1 Tax=Teratosphaeria destructans TaxID=418781 RepID=A0A9W7W2G9_9PEZI|nr:hypothetical protein Tdes44962_MAKER02990 [Teratosphaeria destructans]
MRSKCKREKEINPYNKLLHPAIEQLIRHPLAALGQAPGPDGRQATLDHVLDVQRGPDLMQDGAHVAHARIGQQDEFQLRGRLEVVQFVLGGAVGEEGVGGAPSWRQRRRREKMVPKMSLVASASLVVERGGRAPALGGWVVGGFRAGLGLVVVVVAVVAVGQRLV